MLTTCPECRTTFRVAHDQLESRRGMVRCGTCQAVFNAYDTLLPELESPERAELDASPPNDIPAGPSAETAPDAEPLPEPESEPGAEQEFGPLLQDEAEPEPKEDPFAMLGGEVPRLDVCQNGGWSGGEEDSTPDEPFPMDSPPEETPDSILLSELPVHSRTGSESRFWLRASFALLSLLLLLTLAGQLAYFLRGPIVDWQPDLRPLFERVCAKAGCRIPLSRQLGALTVESSSLETDPEQHNHATLKVNFSNRSNSVLAWPCFKLRLSDLRGIPVAQRVFWPKDYLPQSKPEGKGMAPMSELDFHLELDLNGLSASGYEIKPVYP